MTPPLQTAARVRHIFLSPGHNFRGHYGVPAGTNPILEVPDVRCVAGKGLEGDRYFGFKENFKGQVTFFAWEVYRELCAKFGRDDVAPSVFRRNVITEGADLNQLIGVEFELQGIRFAGSEECSPCEWMDQAFGPGAEAALAGRGGLRVRILSDGLLRVA